jgi:hypothetical protein
LSKLNKEILEGANQIDLDIQNLNSLKVDQNSVHSGLIEKFRRLRDSQRSAALSNKRFSNIHSEHVTNTISPSARRDVEVEHFISCKIVGMLPEIKEEKRKRYKVLKSATFVQNNNIPT